jgi:hypothetical protein
MVHWEVVGQIFSEDQVLLSLAIFLPNAKS